ncbi:MAG: AraC family transcriptional regulator [Verrucomicrobia bacterium]|nr:AraC family transcriptional regulator [Verrucomicrobiota bacterium]
MAPRSSKPVSAVAKTEDLYRAESRGSDLHMFGRALYLPGGWHGPRSQNVFFLITILEGSVEINYNSRRIQLGSGEGVILPPRGMEFFRFDPDVKSVHHWCQIAPSLTNRHERELIGLASHPSPVPASVNILIEEGLSIPVNPGPHLNLAMQILAKACLLRFAAQASENISTKQPRHQAVERALEAVSMNPARFRSAEDLAHHCGISYSRLRKLFQDDQGETPTAMIWRLKADQAIQLIRATGLTLAEVAEQCGFSNAFHLSRCVKDRTGIPPRELRKTEQATGR